MHEQIFLKILYYFKSHLTLDIMYYILQLNYFIFLFNFLLKTIQVNLFLKFHLK